MLRSLLGVSLDLVCIYLHPEVRGTVLVCVRVPKPQQQQHRTVKPAAAAEQLRVGGRESWHRSG